METRRLPQPVHERGETPPAPGDLELVRAFLSLHDHEQGNPDGLPPSLESLRWWLAARALVEEEDHVKDQDLAWALRVRDALTTKVRENMGSPADPTATEFLNRAAEQTGLRVCFGCDEESPIHVEATGVRGAIGRYPGFRVPRRARRALGTIPHLPRPRMLFGVLRSLEEQERKVVLHGFLWEQSEGPRVPGTAGRGMTTLGLELAAPGGEPGRSVANLDLARVRGALANGPGRRGSIPRLHGSRSRRSTARVRVSQAPQERTERSRAPGGRAQLEVLGPMPGPKVVRAALEGAAHVLRLDQVLAVLSQGRGGP